MMAHGAVLDLGGMLAVHEAHRTVVVFHRIDDGAVEDKVAVFDVLGAEPCFPQTHLAAELALIHDGVDEGHRFFGPLQGGHLVRRRPGAGRGFRSGGGCGRRGMGRRAPGAFRMEGHQTAAEPHHEK